jgi:hypothetical protein
MTCGFFWRIKNAIELSYVLETVCLINKHLSDGDQNAFHHGTWPEKRRNVRQSARRIRVYKHLLYQLPLFLFTPHLLNYSPRVHHILRMTCGFSGKLKKTKSGFMSPDCLPSLVYRTKHANALRICLEKKELRARDANIHI